MQSFEYVLLGLVLAGSAERIFLTPRPFWLGSVYIAGAVLLLAAHLTFEGTHWQVWPLYLALVLSIVLQLAGPGNYTVAACVAVGLAISSAALCWALPVFSLPPPTGFYAVGTHSEIIEDRTRGADGIDHPNRQPEDTRRLPIRVWYPGVGGTGRDRARYTSADELKPLLRYRARSRTNSLTDADPVSGQTFPVILFGPRWGGSRVQDSFLTEELASHGYIVVAIDHPGNAALVDTGARVMKYNRNAVSIPPALSAASVETTWADELKIWTADDQAVLNTLLARSPGCGASAFYALDADRIGAFGHSFGGASSLALLGTDPRVKSAVNLDGWVFNGLEHRTTEPVMLVYEASAEDPQAAEGPEAELNAADRAAVTASLTRFGGLVAYIAGSQHMDFTDQTLVSPLQRITFTGPIEGSRMREITRGLVVGFFDQTLKGQGHVPVYPEVKMRVLVTR